MTVSGTLPGIKTNFYRIQGYTICSQIYVGTHAEIYRATQDSTQRAVILKLVKQRVSGLSGLAQLHNWMAIAQLPKLVGTLAHYDFFFYNNQLVVVMEDFAGRSLIEYTKQGSEGLNLSTQQFLKVTIQIADILRSMQEQRIIHKDIKPDNFLIDPQSLQIRLVDFSVASRLPREQQQAQRPSRLEGTLAYMAPEQTGRMNRGTDYRSDFYALGVTLYQLLSKQLPFQSNDPLELLHGHIAKQPTPIQHLSSEVPATVAAIVHKLIEKNAENRYQSAAGLKYDLELCLDAWEKSREIPKILLGQKDRDPQFVVSEKLYGREQEVKTLLAAFERAAQGSTELTLVDGFSGIGKTALVNELHRPILEKQGLFISGKFDQFNRDVPFSAVTQAFKCLIAKLLREDDDQLAQWQHKIQNALGDQGQVIVDVLPDLSLVIGPQPPVARLASTAARNRFNQVFQQFIQVFASSEHSLTVFLDDLQWIDLASLQLIESLLQQAEGHLLIVGAYRSNEVYPAHPLMQMVESLAQKTAAISTVNLSPLPLPVLNQFVADTLRTHLEHALPLTELIYRKTKGNPFFTTQLLKSLHEETFITFNAQTQKWQYDSIAINEFTLTDDVVELMSQQLKKFPTATQEALKLAACIGNRFELDTLSLVCGRSTDETAKALWDAMQEGTILPLNEDYKCYQGESSFEANVEGRKDIEVLPRYRFLHDRVQQAAYALIPDTEKAKTHARIGQILWNQLSESEQEERLFDLINQLNLGREKLHKKQQYRLSQLNLSAGKKARLSAAYAAAHNYCQIGIDLLPDGAWERSQESYQLMYELHLEASEAAYLCGRFEQAEALYAVALDHCQTSLCQARVYRACMTQYELQCRHEEAIAIQRKTLRLLGWLIPETEQAIEAALVAEVKTVNEVLTQRSVESCLQAQHMTEPEMQEMMRVLQILFYSAWLSGQPTLGLLAVAKMATLSLQKGNSEMSPFGYVGYSMILVTRIQDYALGHRFGEMAVQLCEQFDNADVRSMTNFLFAADVHSWSRPIRAAEPYFEAAYRYGMEAGNWLTVSFMMKLSGSDRLTYGKPLRSLYKIAQTHADFLRRIQSQANLDVYIAAVLQPIRQLLGKTRSPFTLDDAHFSESQFIETYRDNDYALAWIYAIKIRHAYLLKDEAAYPALVQKLPLVESALATHTKVPSAYFYVALMTLSLIERSGDVSTENSLWATVDRLKTKLQHWAEACAENVEHKCVLIAAEKARLQRRWGIASDGYDRAIRLAAKQSYRYEVALANELAAQLYDDWNKPRLAQEYLLQSFFAYSEWGAIAKLKQLKQQHANLFQSIELTAGGLLETSSQVVSFPTQRSRIAQGTSAHQSLDLTSILKASQALSSEIQLDQMVTALLKIVLENAGANRCALLLPEEDTWRVKATAQNEYQFDIVFSETSLAEASDLPLSLINLVKRSKETVIIADATADEALESDAYIAKYQPKSLLCLPLKQQGKLSGLLYLENNQTADAFTPNRIEVLNLLSSQAAISLENVRLYQQQEALVEARTRELAAALDNLKQSQAQLVQKERMSSLGQLVAGVAHEINNPVSFIYGNLSATGEYIKDLIQIIEVYQQEYPNPEPAVTKVLEEIEPEFVVEDLSKILVSMEAGAQRISNIVLSLRNFSRLDEVGRKRVDIREGIDSTLMLLHSQLVLEDGCPIQVMKHYAELPKIDCFVGELNQTLLNILSNAIDALVKQSACVKRANDSASTAYIPRIEISTAVKENAVAIIISDNGAGIAPEIQGRIFDPFFTGKAVGEGTGMGLAIAHQTIVEKHAGRLTVSSTLGEGSTFTIELPINS